MTLANMLGYRYLVIVLFLGYATALSTPLAVSPNYKYCSAGSAVFSTASYYPSGPSSVFSLIFTIPLMRPMNDTAYRSTMAIEQIYAEIANRNFDITFSLGSKTNPSLKVEVTSSMMNKIRSMRIRYMVLDSGWGVQSGYYLGKYTNRYISSSTPYSWTQTFLGPLNMAGTVQTFSALTGFEIQTTTNNGLSLKLTAVKTTSSTLQLTLSSTSTTSFYVYLITYSEVAYNVGDINALPGRITLGYITATNAGALNYLDSTNITRDYNTMIGLRGIHVNNEAFVSWNGTITPEVSIGITSDNSFLSMEFIYMIVETNWCQANLPYLLISTSICYDVCPARYYANDVGLSCQSCLYDCYECSSASNCQTCNTTTDFREMNNATQRCDPLPGYYNSGATQAVLCNSPCLTCSSSTACITCISGYIKSVSTCFTCSVLNCATCSSVGVCTLCESPYSLASSSSCVLNCTLVTSNCLSCSDLGSGIECILCQLGYSLNSINKTCQIICGDNLLGISEECDDGNLNNGDGCSSTCIIENQYYCNATDIGKTSICGPCQSQCLNCSDLNNCSLCDTFYVLNGVICQVDCSLSTNCSSCQVNGSTIECLACDYGFSLVMGNCGVICGDSMIGGNETCDDGNLLDGDGCSSTCSVENASFCQGAPSSCYPCLTDCLDCLDNSSCITCDPLSSWNASSLTCEATCSLINQCSTCSILNSSIICSGCNYGYSLDVPNNLCPDICGDSMIGGNETCDDGNLLDGDGCSSTCSVENASFCQGAPSSCYPCLTDCLDCLDNSSCITCDPLSSWNASSLTCEATCSLINQCSTCSILNSSIICSGCNYGYSLDVPNNLCPDICGDSMIGGNETCDDGNLLDGDGCSSTCSVENASFCQGAPSSCYPCLTDCLDCLDNSSCITCDPLSSWNASSLTCEATCSLINQCSTCSILNSSIICSGCNYGYSLDVPNNLCPDICGDSMIGGNETCDDGNLLDGDGCSSTCSVENASFCQGAPSSCYPCLTDCLDCLDNSSCITCDPLSSWNASSLTCEATCSLINQCSTCSILNSSIICSGCNYGYSLDVPNNMCPDICGDSMIGGNETCDDGNLLDGDGCSSTCSVENASFCQGAPSSCYPCLTDCLDCLDNSSCITCDPLSSWNASSLTCEATCSLINQCSTCSILNSSIICSGCNYGYSLDVPNNLCPDICGDSMIGGNETCDDGNLLDGDGCSSTCSVENASFCQGAPSSCYPCLTDCLDCLDNSSCITCDPLSSWNASSLTCEATCSLINQCSTCSILNSSIICSGCNYGYSLDVPNNLCPDICGDSMIGGNETCDDGNLLDGDGCSSTCSVENASFCQGAPSSCYPCLTDCLDCLDNSSCITCDPLSSWNASSLTCEATCSLINQCSTCSILNSSIICSGCNYGYSLDVPNNLCPDICGDSMIGGNETCDDGNLLDGDGCSSTCSVENASFCQGAPSSCYPCLTDCLDCLDNSSCITCDPLSSWNASSLTCEATCSLINQCSTCSILNSSIICSGCNYGYSLDVPNNMCPDICGDSMIGGNETCDDGNLLDGDGCSSTCSVENASFCQGAPSSCYPCLTDCLDCLDNSSCITCDPLSSWNASSLTCEATCSLINQCSTCSILNSSIICSGCNYGYSLDVPNNLCPDICGDSMIGGNETCDDGNLLDGDGCSSTCSVENASFCQGAPSSCYPCLTDCLDCLDNSSCITCDPLSSWNASSLTCEATCSLINQCSTCSILNSSIICSGCNYGYSLDVPNNLCPDICGDSMIGGNETCDDGNLLDGDGCSSTCSVENASFCQGAPSSCYPCLTDCLDCLDNSSCITCDPLSSWNASSLTCEATCSLINQCSTCSILNSSIICSGCNYGYSLDVPNNLCPDICGDSMIGGNETCDDGNLLDGDGCSSTCSVENASFCQGAPSSCYPCLTDCLDCLDNSSCITCDPLSSWNASSLTCEATCSLINQCSTCSILNSSIICSGCNYGYSLDVPNNLCPDICGDSMIGGNETCDDGNLLDGDGCSSTCSVENASFCQGAPSSCYPCLTDCLDCLDNSSCTSCSTLTVWNTTSILCEANCTKITYCFSCQISNISNTQTVICTLCNPGFALDSTNTTCIQICGDGFKVGIQQCDDNNTISGDGCSSICIVQSTYFCLGQPSVCDLCLMYCLTCPDNLTCNNCSSITIWDPLTPECFANCTVVNYCTTCAVVVSSGGDFIQCLTCSGGYSVDSSNICSPICGDGSFAPEEICQDGNTNSGDGCDPNCQVESYFACNLSSTTNISQCYLTELTLQKVLLIKNEGQNTGSLSLKPSPPGLPVFSQIDWKAVIKIPSQDMTIKSVTYDPNTGNIIVEFQYSTNINNKDIVVDVHPQNDNHLALSLQTQTQVKLSADNNAAFAYYQTSDYMLSTIAKYGALALGVFSILFIIAGLFGGKLIGLECAGVIQLSFISLLTLQDQSSNFAGLQMLKYSLGYNSIQSYNLSQSIDRPYKAAQFNQQFIFNCNFMAVLIIIPMIVALVFKIISSRAQKDKKDKWLQRSKYAIGQFTLYLFLSFSYLIYLSLFIQVKYLNSEMISYAGIGGGVILIALGIVYAIVFAKADSYFTQFRDRFCLESGPRRFYLFIMAQKFLSPAFLVFLSSKNYGNAPILVLYVALALILLKIQPYKGERNNYRPFANYLIVVLVSGIYLGITFTNDPNGMLASYGPLVIIALLFICVIYSIVALIRQLRQECQTKRSEQINKSLQVQMKNFTHRYQSTISKQRHNSILYREDMTDDMFHQDSLEDEDSPNRLDFTNIRQKLNDLKCSNGLGNQTIMNNERNQGQMLEAFQQFEDSI